MVSSRLIAEFIDLLSGLSLVILSSHDSFLIQTLNRQLQSFFTYFITYLQNKDNDRSKALLFQLANLETTLSILFYLKKIDSLGYLESERKLLAFKKSLLELNIVATSKSNTRVTPIEFFRPSRKTTTLLNPTKKRILGFISETGETLNSDVFDYFKDISKRTLKRHLSDLIGTGYLNRQSQGKKVYYKKPATDTQQPIEVGN